MKCVEGACERGAVLVRLVTMPVNSILWCLFVVAGCTESSQTSRPQRAQSTVNDSGTDASVSACLPSESDPDWRPPTRIEAWSVDLDGIRCEHPEVVADCTDGWCRIPAGCYVMGSPPTEWGRGAYNEDERATVLTHAFRMQQFEVTRAQWFSLGFELNRSSSEKDGSTTECMADDCPVTPISWYEAVAYANELSEREGHRACYVLHDCRGTIGVDYQCTDVDQADDSLYDCTGYRLPMEVEWEYAARAGTKTAFYSGTITPQGIAATTSCCGEHALQLVAWYCDNSSDSTHKVGGKLPNAWGLYDVLGNAFEWVNDPYEGQTPKGPLIDYGARLASNNSAVIRGGGAFAWPTLLRSSSGPLDTPRSYGRRGSSVGFRLVILDD